MSESFEIALQPLPICPYCGTRHADAWEVDFGPGLDGEAVISCNECGRDFMAIRETTTYYTTLKGTP